MDDRLEDLMGKNWSELDEDVKRSLLQRSLDDLFWERAKRKLEERGKFLGVIGGLITFGYLTRDTIVHALRSVFGG